MSLPCPPVLPGLPRPRPLFVHGMEGKAVVMHSEGRRSRPEGTPVMAATLASSEGKLLLLVFAQHGPLWRMVAGMNGRQQ